MHDLWPNRRDRQLPVLGTSSSTLHRLGILPRRSAHTEDAVSLLVQDVLYVALSDHFWVDLTAQSWLVLCLASSLREKLLLCCLCLSSCSTMGVYLPRKHCFHSSLFHLSHLRQLPSLEILYRGLDLGYGLFAGVARQRVLALAVQ